MRIACTLAVFGVGLVAPAAAHAEYVGMTLSLDKIVPGYVTYRIFANFDAGETVLAVSGDADIAGLEFQSSHPLFQSEGPLDGLALGDRPTPLDETGADSWVTIGGNWMAGHSDVSFSPDFLGGDGIASVINGTSFSQADNGGYFDSNPGTPETGSVIIAQFTLPTDLTQAAFAGTLNYSPGAGVEEAVAFSVVFIPGPASAAAFAVLVIARPRRRRQ